MDWEDYNASEGNASEGNASEGNASEGYFSAAFLSVARASIGGLKGCVPERDFQCRRGSDDTNCDGCGSHSAGAHPAGGRADGYRRHRCRRDAAALRLGAALGPCSAASQAEKRTASTSRFSTAASRHVDLAPPARRVLHGLRPPGQLVAGIPPGERPQVSSCQPLYPGSHTGGPPYPRYQPGGPRIPVAYPGY